MADAGKTAKLTSRTIDAAKPAATRYVIWDSEKKGFGVRIEVSGVKSFLVRYRAGEGGRMAPRREVVLGRYGNWTAEKARAEAGKILNAVDNGKDPALDRRTKRAEKTIADLCDIYLVEGVTTKKPSTIATDTGRIERHIKPLMGKRLITEINQSDIERLMRDIAKGKTKADVKTKLRGRAIVDGGKGTATRTVGLLGGIFTFAVRNGLRPDNPVRGVKRYADKKGERFLSANELATLGQTLREFEAMGANNSALAIIRLLTFTGARKSEIATLKWNEIDLERSCLRLGDSKTGAKVIAIGPPALAILAGLERTEGSNFVFPAEAGEGAFQGTEKVWSKIRTAANFKDVRIHDLRHSFASVGLASGDALPIIGKLLGHSDIKTTLRYAHLADDPLKAAASRISGNIAAAMDAKPSAEIIKFKQS